MGLSRTLAGIGQGLGQVSQAFLLDEQIKLKKEEQKIKEKHAELVILQVSASKRLAAGSKTTKLSVDSRRFTVDSERKEWLKLPKNLQIMKEIQELSGDDPEQIMLNITSETSNFQARRDGWADYLDDFSQTAAVKGTPFADQFAKAAIRARATKDTKEFQIVANDQKDLMTLSNSFVTNMLKSSASITQLQESRDFIDAEPGDPAGRNFHVIGVGTKFLKSRKDARKFQVTSAQGKEIRQIVSDGLKIMPAIRGVVLDQRLTDVLAIIQPKINEMIQDGQAATTATHEVFGDFQTRMKEVDKIIEAEITDLIKRSKTDPDVKKTLIETKSILGTLNPRKMSIIQKIKLFESSKKNPRKFFPE